eukprot:6187484-Pleurochrysis_carterae.AAC.2
MELYGSREPRAEAETEAEVEPKAREEQWVGERTWYQELGRRRAWKPKGLGAPAEARGGQEKSQPDVSCKGRNI